MKKQTSKINNINNRRHHSAGMFYTSSAGAVASLILMCRCSIVPISMIVSLCFINIIILSLTGATNTFAVGSVSLSVSSNTVDLSITPTRVTGTFAKSDNISISASTNNSTGYTLMLAASSSTDYDKLKNTTTNTSLSSISSATTEESFKALNGTAYNGKWGYLPSKYCTNGESNSCTTNTDFLPAPTVGGDIISKTDCANGTIGTTCSNNTDNYTLAIGARVDSTTKIGAYTNTYNVVLVANEVPYTITYHDNIITNMPVDVASASSASTVNISNNTPQRAGYSFLGWCSVQPTTTNGTDTCIGGTQYAAGDAWTLGASDNNLSLYAMWSGPWIQDFTNTTCQDLASSSNFIVYDKRDDADYTVRYINGNCWMTQNLRFTGTSINPTDTNIDTAKTMSYGDLTSGNSYTQARIHNSNSKDIGERYNYCATTAGTVCNTTPADASYSLCPSGWRLPTREQYLTITSYTSKFNPITGGNYADGALRDAVTGYWWTATKTSDGTLQLFAHFQNASNLQSASSYYKYAGNYVRCIRYD